MKTTLKIGLLAAVASLTLPQAAFASNATTLEIKNYVGRITVQTGNVSKIEVTQSDNAKSVNISESRASLTIDGNIKKPDGNKCVGYYGKYSFSWGNKNKSKESGNFGGYKDLDTFPNLTITAPDDVTVIVRNSIPFGTVDDIEQADIQMSYCGNLTVGNINGFADITLSGSGDFKAHNAGDTRVSLTGSGDVDFHNVQNLNAALRGSGDIEINSANNVKLSLTGSGDVEIDDVSGFLDASIKGSGDISIDDVSGGAELDASGSGDIEIGSILGAVSINSRGSSTIEIDDGRAEPFYAKATGSGTVYFDGTAINADMYASGSADIYVAQVGGKIHSTDSGAGDIDIGDYID